MEEISFKPLSEGLGFYDSTFKMDVSGHTKKTHDVQNKNFLSSKEWSDSLLLETLDLDDSKNYEHLVSLLETPWLGKSRPDFSENGAINLKNKEEENQDSSPVTKGPLPNSLVKKKHL